MNYLIKVLPVGYQESFSYYADTHPTKGEYIYLRDTRYKVESVGHILTTINVGSRYEKNELSYVELTVTEE